MAEPTVRIVRILVYEGTPEWLQKTFWHNAVKRDHVDTNGNRITEVAIYGLDPESRRFLKDDGLT